MNDWVKDWNEKVERVQIALYNLGVAMEATLERLSEDGNIIAQHLLHKIYWERSFEYRIQYAAALYVSKIVRWMRMTRYA